MINLWAKRREPSSSLTFNCEVIFNVQRGVTGNSLSYNDIHDINNNAASICVI